MVEIWYNITVMTRKNILVEGKGTHIVGTVVEFGRNGAHMSLPKAWLGRRVKVIPLAVEETTKEKE
jgi:putative transposon-encoded protein